MADEAWMDDDHVVLTDEEGKDHTFEVVDVIEVQGKEYAILAPTEEEEEEADDEGAGEAMIFRIDRDDEGEQVLVEIEDDEEWERVAAEYDRLVDEEDEEDYEELDEEEDGDEGEDA
ncbi:MAG: DUF1292 domain-containing protein [Firmicutes bacterium]|nr:DUF1292 domain-containing protein [Bacillota bacterium]